MLIRTHNTTININALTLPFITEIAVLKGRLNHRIGEMIKFINISRRSTS